jgi:branched-chain amino acid transport system substrate-binding protein
VTRRVRVLLLAFALVAGGAACGGDDEDGGEEGGGEATVEATGEPIKIGGIFDLTGATADVGTPYAEGVRAYVDFVNEDGGIEGRTIELTSEDYAYDVARAEQLYSRLTSEGVVAIQGWGTGDTEALRGRVTTDELPFMSASYSAELIDPSETPYNFVVATSYSDQMRIALKWIAEDAGGPAEVAVFHHDSPFGESPVADGEAYIEEQGLDLGYQAYAMPTGATDYVSELSRARSQGANYIVIQNVSTPAAQLAQDVQRQNLDIQIVCLNWCGDELFIDLAGEAAEGVVAVMPFAPATSDAEGISQPADALASGSIEEKGVHYVQGWYTMAVMTEGIRHAVEAGEEVTGPSLKEALEAMGPFETGDVTAPIDFSEESHAGMQGSRLFRVEDGVFAELTDFMEP